MQSLTAETKNVSSERLKIKEIEDETFFGPRLGFVNMRECVSEDMWYMLYDDSPENPKVPCVVCFRWKLQYLSQISQRVINQVCTN